MALQTVKKFFELVKNDVVESSNMPWSVWLRLCVAKAYAHVDDNKTGWTEFVSPEIAEKSKPKSKAGTIGLRWLNILALPYFLVSTVRSFFTQAINKIEMGGQLAKKSSSKVAMLFKGIVGLLYIPEAICFLIAKVGDKIISGLGMERKSKAPADIPLQDLRAKNSVKTPTNSDTESLSNKLSNKPKPSNRFAEAFSIVKNYKKSGGFISAISTAFKILVGKAKKMPTPVEIAESTDVTNNNNSRSSVASPMSETQSTAKMLNVLEDKPLPTLPSALGNISEINNIEVKAPESPAVTNPVAKIEEEPRSPVVENVKDKEAAPLIKKDLFALAAHRFFAERESRVQSYLSEQGPRKEQIISRTRVASAIRKIEERCTGSDQAPKLRSR